MLDIGHPMIFYMILTLGMKLVLKLRRGRSHSSSSSDLYSEINSKVVPCILPKKTINMEEQICQHSKFGFCKYKKEFKRKHFSEEFKDLAMCKNMKMCMKRHPKGCKRYSEGQCRFETECAYKHQDEAINRKQVNLNNKVLELEKGVEVITEKHVSLNEKAME